MPQDRLLVVMTHIPLRACKNREALFRVLETRPHTFSISAHTHDLRQTFLDESAGWHGLTPLHNYIAGAICGCWWCGTFDEAGIPHATMNDGAPNGYSIIAFDGNRYSIRYKATRRPADYQMSIYLPDEVAQADAQTTEVLVNVFAGSERSTVEMRVGNGGDWTPLEQTTTTDPEILRMHNQNDFLNEEVFGWKMDEPSKTNHMWKGRLPEGIAAGTHTVFVHATDMFGQTWTARRIMRVR